MRAATRAAVQRRTNAVVRCGASHLRCAGAMTLDEFADLALRRGLRLSEGARPCDSLLGPGGSAG